MEPPDHGISSIFCDMAFLNNNSLALPLCIVLFESESYASRAFAITFSKLLEDLETALR